MRSAGFDHPDLMLDILMDRWPETVAVFIRYRMFCVGCMIAQFHTVADACQAYGLDQAQFLEELRDAITAAPELR